MGGGRGGGGLKVVYEPKHPRHQSQTERDFSGLAAKREREDDRARRDSVPELTHGRDDITDQHPMGEERQTYRRDRDPLDRVDRLEVKHDKLDAKVDAIGSKVDVMSGKLDVLPSLVDAVKTMAGNAMQRETVTFTAKVGVDKEKEITKLKVDEVKTIADIEDIKSQKKFKRQLILKVVAVVGSIAASLAALATLAIEHC